jgi:SAM-dependent methyltransferase
MDRTEHWDRIYERRSPGEVSWYERTPTISMRRVRQAVAGGARSLLDVGGGASTLVDEVLELGLHRIAVLDVSKRALDTSRERLGLRADRVEWIVGDVTAIDDVGMFDIWHDRAVFHFLTDPFDQERYVSLCERTVAPAGIAIVATFAPEGPEMCSGLTVQRYDTSALAERCGPRFELLDSERYVHLTPHGVEQRFLYASFRRASGRSSKSARLKQEACDDDPVLQEIRLGCLLVNTRSRSRQN